MTAVKIALEIVVVLLSCLLTLLILMHKGKGGGHSERGYFRRGREESESLDGYYCAALGRDHHRSWIAEQVRSYLSHPCATSVHGEYHGPAFLFILDFLGKGHHDGFREQ